MSKLRKIIRMMLCLPMAPIIGVGGVGGSGSGSDSGNNNPNNPDNNSDNTNNDSNNNSDSNNNQDQGKTFTQAEVNRMMKAEKESGRRSILKELGVEDVKGTKEALEKYQKYLDSQKSDLEKANENLNETQAKLTSAENRANKAEFCLKAIAEFEANPKSVDDLVAIAMTKVTDDDMRYFLFKAVEGIKQALEEGHFKIEDSEQQLLKMFKRRQSSINEWIYESSIKLGDIHGKRCLPLYSMFNAWCDENGYTRRMTMFSFKEELCALFDVEVQFVTDSKGSGQTFIKRGEFDPEYSPF